jgi:hypothetical protein
LYVTPLTLPNTQSQSKMAANNPPAPMRAKNMPK